MKYNKLWTKECQKKLLEMNKIGKSEDEIREYFGSLLQYHPDRYNFNATNKLLRFVNFNNEAYINEFKKIDYKPTTKLSFFYNFKKDYILSFKVNDIDYKLILFYLEDEKDNIVKTSYNIVFTKKQFYDNYVNYFENFISKNKFSDLSDEEKENFINNLKNILEKETKINNPNDVLNAVSFVLIDFYNNYLKNISNDIIFSIGNTERKTKIKWYRHIIKNSFDNVEETIDTDYTGNEIYYYKINGIKLKSGN